MTIRAELADGRILEFPDGTDPGVIQATVKRMIAAPQGAQDFSQVPTAELEAMPSAPTSISDIARSLGIGVVGGAKALTDVFGAGSTASEYLGETARELQKGLTPARQAEIAKRQELEKRAAESGDTLKEVKTFLGGVAEAPLQSLVQGVGSSAPTLLASLAAIPAGAPAGLALGVGIISRAALGAAQGVGEQKGSILDEVEQAYIKAGYEKEQARELALKAQEYSQDKALQFGGAALLGALDAFTGMESGVSKAARAAASKKIAGATADKIVEGLPEKELTRPGVIGSAARSAIGEAPLEGVQGGYGQYSTNLALIKEGLLDPDLAMQGVYGAAARDAAVGALTGAAFTPVEQANRMREYQMDQALRQQQDAGLAVSEEELAQRFPDVLPGGFKINREELGTETVPQGFSIMAEGRDEPLSVVDTQDEANAKLEALTKIRGQEREKILKDEEKINADVKKARDRLEYLEATEQTGTEEYQSLKAELPNLMDESAQKIKDLYERSESLSKPLTVMPFGETQRVNEQFNVLGPDQKPVGTFKTIGEAEAVVTKAVGEDVFKQTQQNREVAKELYKTFVPQMRKFGLGDVGLSIVDRIENGAGGAYLNKLIKVSLEEANPVQTMRHEALHAMKDLGFFTPQQWKALEDRANKQWIKELKEARYDEKQSRYDAYVDLFTKEGEQKGFAGKELEQYVNEAVVEEAIADAFGAYDKGAKPPPGMIASLYKKIKDFFASLGQAFRGAGFQSADDIFQSIERGRLKPAAEAKPAAEEKLSLAPEGIPQKIWTLHEKVQLADEESTGRIAAGKAPGTLRRNQTMTFRRLNKEVMDFVGGDQQKALDLMSRMSTISGIRDAVENEDNQALDIYKVTNPKEYEQETKGEKSSLKRTEIKTKEKEDETTRPAKSVKRPGPRGKLSLAAPAEREGAGRGERGPGQVAPLEGAPSVPGFSGPISEIVNAAEKYAKDNGIPYKRQASYVRVDPDRATRIAQAYADMPHAPQDAKVREAYDDLIEQTTAQYKALVDAGYKFWFMDMSRPDNQEYASSPWNALRDLRNNKEMGVFPTNDGFGSSDAFNPDESPLLRTTEFKWPVGGPNGPLQPVLANDLFRAVHDAFGHGIEGAGFRADGEENAWQAHVRLFKGPAIGAITSETRGQNSWLNYGPNGDKNRTAKIEDTVFADQKTGLMPEWTWEEGRADDQGIVLGTKQPGAISVKAAHYGNARVSELDPAKYGTGLRGAERRRLEQAFDDRIKRRVYFYIRKEDGSTPPPEAGVGNHVYTQQFDNILGPGAEMSRLFREGNGDSNNFESNVIDAGYDGYAAPSMGMMVILNHKVPVNYVGPRSEVGVQKLSLKTPTSPAFKRWFGESKIVDAAGNPMPLYHATYQDFSEFRISEDGKLGAGIYLSSLPEYAESYATKGVVMPLWASVENPFVIQLGNQNIEYENHPNGLKYPYIANVRPIEQKIADFVKEQTGGKKRAMDLEGERLIKVFRDAGHDGIAVKDEDGNILEINVFDKDQLKSTLGNVGAYGQRPITGEEAERLGLTQKEAAQAQKRGDIRFSLKASKEFFDRAEQIPESESVSIIRDAWIGGVSGIGDRDLAYNLDYVEGGKEYTKNVQNFIRQEFGESFPAYRLMSKEEVEELNAGAMGSQLTSFTFNQKVAEAFKNIPRYMNRNDLVVVEMDFTPDHVMMLGHPGEQEIVIDYGVGYNPNEIKVVKGKFSLKRVAFPTAKEAQEAADDVKVPDTPEFKQYIAGSQWVDEDGKAKKFFHATTSNFFEFNDGVIYLSDTAEESAKWGRMAEDRLRERIYKALNKDEKLPFFQQAVDEAVSKDKITKAQGEKFMRDATRNIPDFDGYDLIKKEMDDVLLSLSPERMKIMPLYARAMTPFDFRNKEHVQQVINAFDYTETMDRKVGDVTKQINKQIGGAPTVNVEHILDGLKGILAQGYPKVVERPDIMRTIRKLGFDGYVVRRNRTAPMSYAVFKPEQVKSITGNNGQFITEAKDVRYSLPNLSKDTMDRMKDVTPQRYQPGWKERVIGGLKPDYTELRQRFLNRYETFANYDERNQAKIRAAGGPELLADQRAEFAALQSDLSAGVAASAMGIGDRQGGVPVYRNGFTTIDTSVKGLVEALAPLAKQGDPEVYQRYQFWAGWKRGRRLLRENREDVYKPADAKRAMEIEAAHPEFIQVQKDLIAFNNGIVKYAVQTGVLSRERAQLYTQYADYIPFYRQLDLDKTIGPNPFSGISGVRGPKELKGGESPLGDFLENMVRNTQSMINAGMKNAAAQRATKVALEIKEVERLPGKADGLGFDVYTQLENGQLVYYRSSDSLFIEALKSLNMPDLPFMGLLSAPANVLRNLVTKDPGFMMANLLRDSLSSYVTSGQKITPIVGTMVNFGKALSGKDKNLQALFNAGIIGGYEFSQNIEQSGQSLSDDLNKKAGKDPILLRPFKSLWEGLEKGTTASDAATRMAVYERVMKETGNEAEAISRALEVMNFNRKGNSVLIRIATAALPFFNARLQGLDLFYRASTGQMNTQDAKEIKKRFWIRGMTMSALSVMYYLSVADDEEYEKQEEETKDNNWIFPSLGIRIPIPFEVGTLFKTMPERITAYLMGNDTGKELGQSTLRALANTFALNPIPQTFKPIIEAATNYNFFTMRPIVGQGMQEVEARFQVGPGTSKAAEYIGGILNLSPLKVDQVIKGYTGTIGGYVTDVVDSITSQFSDVPKASLRFEQLPVVKRFALDPEARGSVTQFYELQRSVDTVVRTMSLLEKTARPEEFAKYLEDNIGILAVKDYVRDIEKGMKELREMRRTINSSPMKPDEKRDILVDLGRMENNLTANIGQVKKAISELK